MTTLCSLVYVFLKHCLHNCLWSHLLRYLPTKNLEIALVNILV